MRWVMGVSSENIGRAIFYRQQGTVLARCVCVCVR